MAEKEKKDADGSKTSRMSGSRFGGATSRAGASSRQAASKIGTTTSRISAASKTGEDSKGTPQRTTMSRVSTASRLNTGRNSIRPGDEGGGSATKREDSASRTMRPQFGRQNSATRGDKDLQGVKVRGRSGSRDAKDLQFGRSGARDRSKSKEGPGMNFKSQNLANKVTVPEDSQIIKKKELVDLKEELEKTKDELY